MTVLDPRANCGHDRRMSELSWKERLAFHEQKMFLRDRGLVLADHRLLRGHALSAHVRAWEGGGRVRVLSAIVNRADAQNPGNLAQAIQVGNLLGCEVVLIVPNCYASVADRASRHAQALLSSGSPQTEFRPPTVEIHRCSKFAAGDSVWIVDTTQDGGARAVEIEAADLSDEPIYTLRERGEGRTWKDVPENAVHTTALAARADAALFDATFATALREKVSFPEALAKEKRKRSD